METNESECLFLRTWYKNRGCDKHLTDEGYDRVVRNVTRHLPHDKQSSFTSNLRIEVLTAYIEATANPDLPQAAPKTPRCKIQSAPKVTDALSWMNELLSIVRKGGILT